MNQNNNLDDTLKKFMTVTARSKVAVIVPLFGYWKDAVSDQLNAETLKVSLDRCYSSVHQLYIIFVSEAPRLPTDVAQILVTKAAAGNTKGVLMDPGSTYTDYVRKGLEVALSDTDAQFIINLNPWMINQHNGLDILVDRINRDDVKIVSGFNLQGVIDDATFDAHTFNVPKEERDLALDLVGMKRQTAEMLNIDKNFKTHAFLARDMAQVMYKEGFESITTQRVPIFTFNVDWRDLETEAEFEADRQYFISKWKYDPGIQYEQK